MVVVPPLNQLRRARLADAAIALLPEAGVHGVTHRAVDRVSGLPPGTASNYFRTREALLVAAAERVGQLHYADMETIASGMDASADPVDLIAESLFLAATTHRGRYLAIFELQLESLRRPVLAAALADLGHRSVAFTTDHHATHGLDIPPEAVPTMVTLFGGALYTMVAGPPATRELAHDLAAAIVSGALGSAR